MAVYIEYMPGFDIFTLNQRIQLMIPLCPVFYAVKLPDTVHGAKHFSLGEAYKSSQVVAVLALTAVIPFPLLHVPPFTKNCHGFSAGMNDNSLFHFLPLFLLCRLRHLLPYCTSLSPFYQNDTFAWLLGSLKVCIEILWPFSPG